MQRVGWLCLGCLLCWSAWANGAHASPADDEAARRHFESGRAYFERAEYDDAIREYEKSYALSLRSPLLVNISRAHESAGRPKEAADALERWLAVSPPDDPMRKDIESRHARLRTQANRLAQQTAPNEKTEETAPSPTEPAPPPPESKDRSTLLPWLLVGSGSTVLASGVVVTFLGRADISDVENAKQGTRYSSVEDQVESGPRKVVIGSVVAGVGFAAAAAGVLWLLLGDEDAGESKVQLGFSTEGAQVWGRF